MKNKMLHKSYSFIDSYYKTKLRRFKPLILMDWIWFGFVQVHRTKKSFPAFPVVLNWLNSHLWLLRLELILSYVRIIRFRLANYYINCGETFSSISSNGTFMAHKKVSSLIENGGWCNANTAIALQAVVNLLHPI